MLLTLQEHDTASRAGSDRTKFDYDANGNLDGQVDARGESTAFLYDALDRVTTRTNSDGVTQWLYDQEDTPATDFNIGRLTSVAYPGGSQQIDWNNIGLQSSVVRCVEMNCRSIAQGYLYGRVNTVTYPDGEVVTVGYDAEGFISSVSGVATQILWNARSQIRQMDYPNGTMTVRTFDPVYDALDVLTVTGVNPPTVFQADYGYNDAVQVTSVSSTTHAMNLGFGYDDLYRLKTVTDDQAQTFTYDAVGNIKSNSLLGIYDYAHESKPHAVTKAGTQEYTYDANGNTLSVTTRAPDCVVVDRLMNWTADNRLRWVSANGDTTRYRYDADGQRISKSGPGGTTHYFGKLFEVEDPDGAARLVKYYYAGDVLLAREESGARQWYHQDHLGSVRAMTDSGGNRTVAYDYRVFGETTSGSADNTRGFGAHWRDDESNLVYMGARYHDPVLGRFTQPDPLVPEPGDPQSWNRYSYVRNNPFNRIDPTGNIDLGAELGGFLADRFGANRQLGQFLGSLAAGAVPGAGELADLGVVFSLDHRVGTIDRLIATGSLVASVATLGSSPNAGAKIRTVREGIDSSTGAATSGLKEARAARDAVAESVSSPARGRPAAVTAGVNTRTGEVATGCSGGGVCAEVRVSDALGGNPGDIKFTEAVRPRPGGPPFDEVPVCAACESQFGRDRFPDGTTFRTDLD